MKTLIMSEEKNISSELLLNNLRRELEEAKFHKETLEIHYFGSSETRESLALEILAIISFYGNGKLVEFKLRNDTFNIIKRDIFENEIITIDSPTIIEKDVMNGALIIIENSLYVAGSFKGTAILKNYDATLFANNYQGAKVRTPQKDYYPLNFGAREFVFKEVY